MNGVGRLLPSAFATVMALASPVSAEYLFAAEGTLTGIQVDKPDLAHGARASLVFDLDYIVRVSVLMSEPVVNCGLRVRNIRGHVTLRLNNESRQIPLSAENEAQVAILDLGFVLRGWQIISQNSGWGFVRAGNLAFRCLPGVIAREGGQPFNVAGSPSLGRFLCSGALPAGRRLPDALTPDWCPDASGTWLAADEARGVLRRDELRHGDFRPNVEALSIGVAGLMSAERTRMAEERQEEQAQAEAENEARTGPASPIARLAAERARARQSEEGQAAVPATDRARDASATDPDAELQASRTAADQARVAARAACRVNRPVPIQPLSQDEAARERERLLDSCLSRGPTVLQERACVQPTPSRGGGTPGRAYIMLIPPCTAEMNAHNARVEQSRQAGRAWVRTCEAEADAAILRSGPEAQERNRQALAAWETGATACEARAENSFQAAVSDAEQRALRLRSLSRIRAP
jgi:hypothetical protein